MEFKDNMDREALVLDELLIGDDFEDRYLFDDLDYTNEDLSSEMIIEKIASRCVYGADFVREVLRDCEKVDVFSVLSDVGMSSRKLQGFLQISSLRNYYQQNPVLFLKDFFNIQLLDSQAWLFQMAWTTPEVLIVASRAYGKSFWIVLFIMAKQMLSSYPWNCYIASGSSQQSATTFKKLEDIANDRLESLMNSTGYIFKAEVEVPNAAGDGFSHAPSGFEYKIYNESTTRTLNSNVDRNRGNRAAAVIFDETSFLSDDLIQTYKAFCATDKEFKTGVNDDGSAVDLVQLATFPRQIPNQLIYVSSASSTDTEFYRMYREFSKKMIAGDPGYFVANLDCDLIMKPTIKGKRMKPALTQEKIDAALATNYQKARREYYNEFTTDAGAEAIIRRGTITRNEEVRKPLLCNDDKKKKFVLTYDPARSRDNSVITVFEVYGFEKNDIKARIVNSVSLIDIGKKRKTPMRTPDQIEYLKELILDYNDGTDTYDGILGIYIDAGSGGAGVNIADYLMDDWIGKDGELHRGLIDREYSEEDSRKFPNAINKVHLISPSKYKSEMYTSLIEMLEQNKISFTASYDNKGYLMMQETNEEEVKKIKEKILSSPANKKKTAEEIQEIIDKKLKASNLTDLKRVKLDWFEELALANIDAMKEELVNMIRKKREGGKDGFELSPEKANKMHDDRAYTCAMGGYVLSLLRKQNQRDNKRAKTNGLKEIASLPITKGKRQKLF